MVSMRKYARTEYLKVETLGDKRRTEVIAGLIDASASTYDKPILVFKSGARLSLNKTNVGELIRCLGDDSEGWLDHAVDIFVGPIQYNGASQDSVLIEVADPPPSSEKKKMKGDGKKPDMDDEIPF